MNDIYSYPLRLHPTLSPAPLVLLLRTIYCYIVSVVGMTKSWTIPYLIPVLVDLNHPGDGIVWFE